MSIKLLSSGYWHVRWSDNLWIQWPKGRVPTLSDGFGWITPRHVELATAAMGAGDSNG